MLFVNDKPAKKEDVLNELINRKLGITRARKNKLDQDPTVKYKMEDIMYHAQISKDLEPKLKKISVTDDDVEKYYKSHPEYRTAHILFRVRAQPDEVEIEEALKKAVEVYNTVKKNPGKFAELANKFSQSSTAPSGGDMGFQPSIRLALNILRRSKIKQMNIFLSLLGLNSATISSKCSRKRISSQLTCRSIKKLSTIRKEMQF